MAGTSPAMIDNAVRLYVSAVGRHGSGSGSRVGLGGRNDQLAALKVDRHGVKLLDDFPPAQSGCKPLATSYCRLAPGDGRGVVAILQELPNNLPAFT